MRAYYLRSKLKNLNKWDLLYQIKKTPAFVVSIITLFFLGSVLGLGILTFIRSPIETPVMRGHQLANNLGCFACHNVDGRMGVPNPGSRYGDVLPFRIRGTVMAMLQGEEEIKEWIKYGSPKRMWIDGKPLEKPRKNDGIMKMPAYGHLLSDRDLDDLQAYIEAVAFHKPPADEIALKGYQVSQELGCFGCHGEGGFGGIANPGSFKGYIPPWDGDDYPQLVTSEDELKEWILKGTIERFENNPLAKFFTSRQVIQMPSYESLLKPGQLEAIVSYVRWLRDPEKKFENKWTNPNTLLVDALIPRGKKLYVSTGCAACHNKAGIGGIPNPNTAEEHVPALDDLAEKMQLYEKSDADMFIEFLSKGIDLKVLYDNPPFENYQSVFETYMATRKLIIEGAMSLKKDRNGIEPPIHMPSWEQRRNSDHHPLSVRDVDAIIAYLVSLQEWEDEDEEDEEEDAATIASNLPKEDPFLSNIRNYRKDYRQVSDIEFSGMHWNSGISIFVKPGKTLENYMSNFEVFVEEFDSLGSGDSTEFVDMYKKYPLGSILVKEHYREKYVGTSPLDHTPSFMTVMIKREEGYDPIIQDWQFMKLTTDGEVLIEGNSNNLAVRALCVECHRNVSSRDFVFSTYYEDL